MGFTVPPNTPYQSPLFPIRGLWNAKPVEGDRVVPIEIDWGSQPQTCVKFDAGNSTSPFTQLVAMTVDNTANGNDIEIIFLDSGFQFVVAAYSQPVAVPVFTNGLSFYVNCPGAASDAATRIFLHNSLPPPVQPLITQQQQVVTTVGETIANGTLGVIPATVISGTLTGFDIVVSGVAAGGAGVVNLRLFDGAGTDLWRGQVDVTDATTKTVSFAMSGLHVPFRNGVSMTQAFVAHLTGFVYPNLYYGVP